MKPLAQRTPLAAEKLEDGSSKKTLKSQDKDQRRDMLYYTQKLRLAETDSGEAAESAGSDGQHAQGERGQVEEATLSSHADDDDDTDSQTSLISYSVQDEQEQPTLA